jgi:cell division protein FtsQ
LLVIGLGFLLMAANQYVETLPLRDIEVDLQAGTDNAFLDIADVRAILMGDGFQPLIGQPMNELHLETLEQRLRDNPFVKHAEVSKSMMGVLRVEMSLRRAVGRLINNSGAHLYLDETGHKFPVSRHHSAYVPLIRGDFEEVVADTFGCASIAEALPLLNFLQQHPFWQAQVAEVVIFQDGQMELQPEVGDMAIDFGFPVRIEEKFGNLMDFYKQVIPEVGWRKYRTVSVKYRGQVVAKR